MTTLRVGELCAGYGGISLGLRLAGVDVDLRWLAEFEPALDPLHPAGVPNLRDITTVDWTSVEPVDLITAGFPCQPVSAAGRQLGDADDRWLWPHVRDAVTTLKPHRVLIENVRNLVSIRKGALWAGITADLLAAGYGVRWLTLGACHVGAAHHRHRVFALATLSDAPTIERVSTTPCGAKGTIAVPTPTAMDSKGARNETARRSPGQEHHSAGTTLSDLAVIVGALLPTPTTRDGDGRGTGDAGYGERRLRTGRTNGFPLDATLALLPTPRGQDARHAGATNYELTRNPGTDLLHVAIARATLALLPTPRATDGVNGGPGQRGSAGDLAMPSAVQPQNWDRFAGAVQRHAEIYGPPPAPTEPNRNGAPRLAPAFAEWLMCLPAGHVTAHLPRNAALKAIGNGVCPPQAAAAWRLLADPTSSLDVSLGRGVASSTMTATSADAKEIQDRQIDARQRVIAAGFAPVGTSARVHDDRHMAEIVQAAMMELAAVWRDEAKWWSESGKRGAKGTAATLTECASRVAGFAVGLTDYAPTKPPTLVPMHPEDPSCSRCQTDMHRCPGCGQPVNHDQTACAKCTTETCEHPAEALSMLKSGVFRCTACGQDMHTSPGPLPAVIDLPGGHFDTVSEVILADVAAYLSGATDELGGAPTPKTEQKAYEAMVQTPPMSMTNVVDNPFTSPARPTSLSRAAVIPVPYAALGQVAAATPDREHVSHSFVDSYESCSLSALLREASKANVIGASRPSWSMIGGSAFHACVEAIERGILVGGDPGAMAGDSLACTAMWEAFLDAEVKNTAADLVGTAYADPATWHVANGGKEGFDWWRVEGAAMVKRYVEFHDAAWRQQHVTLVTPQGPAIELPYSMTVRSLDGVTGLEAQGFIDIARMDLSTGLVSINDYKSGRSAPGSTFQLGEYGHALAMVMGYGPAQPVMGSYWLARKGEYTPPIDVLTRHPLTELQYRYEASLRGHKANIHVPNVTNLCSSCSVRDHCPTQSR